MERADSSCEEEVLQDWRSYVNCVMFFPEEPLQCYCPPTLGLLFSIVWQECGKEKVERTMACDLCQNLQERQAVNSEVDDPNPKAATVLFKYGSQVCQ